MTRLRLTRSAVIGAVALAGVALASGCSGARAGDRQDPEALPRDLEIQLAESALPAHLRAAATIYVLDPAKGFEIARRGSNGFTAFVARTGDDTFRGKWPLTRYRDDILYPISFDAAGARANMRVFFDAAALQAKGMAPQQLKNLIQARFRSHQYRPPARAGVSYMMAPILRTYINPDRGEAVETTSNPHVMHYAPNVTNADIGGAQPAPAEIQHFLRHGRWLHNPDPFVIEEGPHGYMIQHLGLKERDEIVAGYAGMLDRLCRLKTVWCLKR